MIDRAQHGCAARRLRVGALVVAGLTGALVLAQTIDDVPPAVRNNVPPNFMFMIDSSGSMSNIVPASPYHASGSYYGACASGSTVPAGTAVDIRIMSGSPRFTYGGGTYRHPTVAGSQTVKCFNNAATYAARLLADSGSAPGSYLDSEYSGHYLNWYFGNYDGAVTGWTDRKAVTSGAVQTRIEIARASAKSVIDGLPLPPAPGASAAVRVGLSTYGSSGGALKVAMSNLTSATATTLRNSIDTIAPGGMTPLASTFADIGRYMATGYSGSITTANSPPSVAIDTLLKLDGTDNSPRNACLSGAPSCTSAASPRPIQYWCQRTSLFAMTDGRPQSDRAFNNNNYVRDYDRDCTGSNKSNCVSNGATGSWDRKEGRTYESAGSDYMDDVAKLLFDIDLRPDLAKPATVPPARNNIATYVIGFADPAVQNDPLLINTARQGGGRFLAATDGPSLVDAFQALVSDALAKDAAAAAVAVTNAQISAGSVGYASSYNSGSWYGDLEAYSLDLSTGLQTGPIQWSARDRLNAQSVASRKIASFDGAGGTAFTTANGPVFRAAAPTLADGIINYIRGDRTGEGATYRARTYLLGDIINSEPVVVNYGATNAIVFQAANDGMLHVIDGRVDASVATRGQELWAYVPRLIHDKLAGRASLSFQHEYLVDGTPATAQLTGYGAVGRILVGGLAKGGAGYYALDITSGTAATQSDAAAKVLWEFRPIDMGYSFGVPLIVNTASGWKVVLTSGYRNDSAAGGLGGDGRGHVWVLNPATGAIEKEFLTPAGYGTAAISLGLAHLGKMWNVAPASIVRHVYAGDLQGNLWRIDLEAASGSALVRIAVTSAPDGSRQPITVPPVVGPVAGSTTKAFVYFGTGQYFSADDVPGAATSNAFAGQVQTIYGVVDDPAATVAPPNVRGTNGGTCPVNGGDGDLVCQSATQATSASPFTATTHAVDLSSRRGFYIDVPISGGRVSTQAALTLRGTLVFVVNQPSNVVCNPGGSSYFFQLSATTGGAIVRTTGSSDYYDAGFFLATALSSRPVLITTATGTRGLFRLSDRTTQSREVNESQNTAAQFKRVYKRALN